MAATIEILTIWASLIVKNDNTKWYQQSIRFEFTQLFNQKLYQKLHVAIGQVESDAGFDVFSVFPVTEESHAEIETGDGEHANVEQSGAASKILRSLHVLL